MDPMTAQVLPYLVPLLILVLILRRNLRSRSLRMERLWLYPAILILAAAGVMRGGPVPGAVALAGYAVALVVGGAIGWYRGRLTQITIDPKTHEFTSRASIAGTILIGVVFAVRYGVRMAMESHGQLTWPLGGRLDVAAITDGLMLFLVGMVSLQRIEMYLRCQKLLGEARAGGATA